jgi:prophage regulatory protein
MKQDLTTENLRIIRIKDVMRITGLSRSTFYRLELNDPSFPRSISLSVTGNHKGYIESEIIGWIMSRRNSKSPEGSNT